MVPTQLCQLAGDFRGEVPAGGMLWQEKKDGWRALYLRDWQGKPGLFTRNGHRIEGAPHILWHCQAIEAAAGQPLFLDGEFQVDGTLAATKAWCERGWKTGGEAGHLHLFDGFPLSDWKAGGCDMLQVERLNRLKGWIDAATADQWEWRPGSHGRDEGAIPVTLLADGWVFDAQDVLTEARRVWAAGGEGIVCKDAEAPYRRNRNAAWLKVTKANAHKWQRAVMCSVT